MSESIFEGKSSEYEYFSGYEYSIEKLENLQGNYLLILKGKGDAYEFEITISSEEEGDDKTGDLFNGFPE